MTDRNKTELERMADDRELSAPYRKAAADGVAEIARLRADLAAAVARAEKAEGALKVWPNASEVSELSGDDGRWQTCSGCHESNEGYPTGPFNPVLGCTVGLGCLECGGIGAVWDTTDYQDMADWLAKELVEDTRCSDCPPEGHSADETRCFARDRRTALPDTKGAK